jgi:hypothetical protein
VKKIINFFTAFLSVARPHLGKPESLLICKSAVVAARHLLSRTSGNQINHVFCSLGTFHPQLCFASLYSSPSNSLVLRRRVKKNSEKSSEKKFSFLFIEQIVISTI